MTTLPTDPQERLSLARYRSRRGMLELDFFLVDFAERALPGLDAAGQETYFRLLACEDVDIHAWLTGNGAPEDIALRDLVGRIQRHAADARP